MFQRGTSGLFARTDPKCGPTLDYLGAEDVSQEKIPPLIIMSMNMIKRSTLASLLCKVAAFSVLMTETLQSSLLHHMSLQVFVQSSNYLET